jgi:hypothetical protein
LLLTLVQNFLGLGTLLYEVAGAIEFLLREQDLTDLLSDVVGGFFNRFLRLLHLGFGFLQGGRDVLGIHAGDDLAGFEHVAFVGKYLGDAPGELGIDVDLVGFDPAVAPGNSWRQLRSGVFPPIECGSGSTDKDDNRERNPKPALAQRHSPRDRHRDRQIGVCRCRHEITRPRRRHVDVLSRSRRFRGGRFDLLAHLVFSPPAGDNDPYAPLPVAGKAQKN